MEIQDIAFEDMPVKAQSRESSILKILGIADTELNYSIKSVDYNTGMIRLSREDVKANLYSTTLTLTIETKHPTEGKIQKHRKKLLTEEVINFLRFPRKA